MGRYEDMLTLYLKDKKPEDVDFVVVRENNEGLYTGAGGFVFKGTPNEIAVQACRHAVKLCAEPVAKRHRYRSGNAEDAAVDIVGLGITAETVDLEVDTRNREKVF